MGCFRSLFGLTLVLRASFHLMVGAYAASDLYNLHDSTAGTFKQIMLKLTHVNEVVKEIEIPLVFYVLCGVVLLILCFIYPWKNSQRSRLTAYAILHILYIGIVVYLVYVRTLVDLSYVRNVYEVMTYPWLFPASLVLDVLTFIAACTGSAKAPPTLPSIVPLCRDRVMTHDDMNPLIVVRA